MSKKKLQQEELNFDVIAKSVKNLSIQEIMNSLYLGYSQYVIQDRALVKEDGLKPVQNRLLFTLYNNYNSKPSGRTIKAATVYNAVVGDYHPHGPSSVSEAGAKLAQNFISRVTLLDFQGTMGKETGDSAPSERYYEIKLSPAGYELVEELKDNNVPTTRNYTDTCDVPTILPVKWPISIINGTSGIAVGFASNIPAHNPDEVMDAVVKRVENKINKPSDLHKYIKGPDFPTGGIILGEDGVKSYIETGSGSFLIRGKYKVEKVKNNNKVQKINFFELPYGVSPEKIVEEVAKQQDNNRLSDVVDVRQLSDKTKKELSFYIPIGVNPDFVVEELFKFTSLQVSFGANITVLLNKKPEQVGLLEVIDQFITLRKNVTNLKLNNNLKEYRKQLNKLNGLISVLIDIDKAISIIRNSETDELAKESLIENFNLNDEQADYILSLQLRRLTKSNSIELKQTAEELEKKIKEIQHLLSDEDAFNQYIINVLRDTQKVISSPRLSEIESVSLEDLKEEEKAKRQQSKLLSKNVDVYIHVLDNGTITKSLEKEIDMGIPVIERFSTKSLNNLYIVNSKGEVKDFSVDNIPLMPQTASLSILGDHVSIVPEIKEDVEGLLIVTNQGNVNILTGAVKSPLVKLLEKEKVVKVLPVYSHDSHKDFLMIDEDSNVLKFKLSEIRRTANISGTITGMKTSENVINAFITEDNYSLFIQNNSHVKLMSLSFIDLKKRGQKLTKVLSGPVQKVVTGNMLSIINEDGTEITHFPLLKPKEKGDLFYDKVYVGF